MKTKIKRGTMKPYYWGILVLSFGMIVELHGAEDVIGEYESLEQEYRMIDGIAWEEPGLSISERTDRIRRAVPNALARIEALQGKVGPDGQAAITKEALDKLAAKVRFYSNYPTLSFPLE